uniref:uncharacterized protein K02A2.6-like n=1 Tax=Anopheles coluzzii TaxID=1518534 RepID=UPI0020FFA2A2|nr:uncharacterized protein K02A2.6-like [Anopheles coluzzii]
MSKVIQFVRQDWPRNSTFSGELACFYARKEALSEMGGCLLFGERVIIPKALRQRCLRQLHHGHPGVQRMKSIARSYVYWPKIDTDIAELVASCNACASAAKSPPHASPVSWPEITAPWQRIHIDYAGPIDGFSYLIVVDAFSKWPEVIRTASTTSKATIRILNTMFARYGMPVTLVSDNGCQFISSEFEDFCICNGIEHLTSAPFHPQSNGQAERFVDTFKRAITKITSDGTAIEDALDTFLQTYRATPNPQVPNNEAPATVMFGRQIRTCLELIRPVPKPQETNNDEQRRNFVPNDLVFAKIYSQNGWKWKPGRILRKCGNVMYCVMTGTIRLYEAISTNYVVGSLLTSNPVSVINTFCRYIFSWMSGTLRLRRRHLIHRHHRPHRLHRHCRCRHRPIQLRVIYHRRPLNHHLIGPCPNHQHHHLLNVIASLKSRIEEHSRYHHHAALLEIEKHRVGSTRTCCIKRREMLWERSLSSASCSTSTFACRLLKHDRVECLSVPVLANKDRSRMRVDTERSRATDGCTPTHQYSRIVLCVI